MDIQKLIDDYTVWLRREITFEKVGDYYEITTPFLDNANDYIQFYVRMDGNTICFTDDGYTLNGLSMTGFQLNTNRRNMLKNILAQYGVGLDGNSLVSKADVKNFAQKKHMFIQAVMKVDDMFMISRNKNVSYFQDDIQSFFDEKEIFYTDNVQFTGVSGFSHNYDYLLQRSRNKPERLCRVMNQPNKNNMTNILFAWNDTKPQRKDDSELIVLINDSNSIAKGVEEAFANYNAKVIKWSEKDNTTNLALLSA